MLGKIIYLILISFFNTLFSQEPEIFILEYPLNFDHKTHYFNSIDVGNCSTPAFTDIDGSYRMLSFHGSGMSAGWNHLAMTCDGRYYKLYINGDLKAENDFGSDYLIEYNPDNHSLLVAEASGGSNPDGYYFAGKIDEVRILYSIRTIDEIRENMYLSLTRNENGFISYWQFNDGSGTTLFDVINRNSGTLFNMDEEDWIDSTIPFGEGVSDT